MPPGALEHVVPVGWILAGAFSACVFVIGLIVGALAWLDGRFKQTISAAFESDAFESRVTKIVTTAINVQVEMQMAELKARQEFQAQSILTAHQKYDKVNDRVDKLLDIFSQPRGTPIPSKEGK